MTNSKVGVGFTGWRRDRTAMLMVRMALLLIAVLAVALLRNGGTPEVGADTGGLLYPTLGSYLSDLTEQSDEPMGDTSVQPTNLALSIVVSGDVQAVVELIEGQGGSPRNVIDGYIEAYVPVSALGALGRHDGVSWVREVDPPLATRGAVTSQGVTLHLADAWHRAGIAGHGVKIGVLDASTKTTTKDGFSGLRQLQGTELPEQVHARCYEDMGKPTNDLANCDQAGGETHGAAMAEIVMDLAPAAELYIANPNTWGDIRSSVEWMHEQGVDVIVSALLWTFHGPPDGTSPFTASPVNTTRWAVDQGILWVAPAGSAEGLSWYGSFTDADDDDRHEWATGVEMNSFTLTSGQVLYVDLRWDDVWGAASKDLRIEVVRNPGTPSETVVAFIDDVQSGGPNQHPIEWLSYTTRWPGTHGIVVKQTSGAAPSWLQLMVRGPKLISKATSGRNVLSPADSAQPGVLGVGAAVWDRPSTIASFSSRGPTPDDRLKPDLVGATCIANQTETTLCGTSGAAANVAGLAALVLQQQPDFTAAQVAAYLKAHAAPRGEQSPNHTWGHGFAQLPGFSCLTTLTGSGDTTGQWADTCPAYSDGDKYSRYYTFRLEQSANVTIKLKSTINGYLYLRHGYNSRDGAALYEDDDGGAGTNAKIRETLAAGTYTIEATTQAAQQSGDFTLSVNGVSARPTTPIVSVSAGPDVTEGETATVIVTVTPAPIFTQQVPLTRSQTGDYGVTTGSVTVTVPASGHATLRTPTVNDEAVEVAGTLTVSVNANAAYQVDATDGSASVGIRDDDSPPALLEDVSATPLEGSVQLDWTASVDEPTEYQVRYRHAGSEEGEVDWTVEKVSTAEAHDGLGGAQYLLTGLEAGQGYRFRVRALNDNGAGPWSRVVVATPLGALPIPELTLEPLLGQIGASWTIPDDAAPVVDYEVSWIRLSLFGAQQQTLHTEQQNALLSPARAGKTYLVQVRSRDLDRVSDWSPTQEVTVWQLPGAIQVGDVIPGGYGELRYAVAIAAGAVGIPAADQVEEAYRISGQQTWTKRTVAWGSEANVIADLTAGATYELRVRAVNEAGAGPWSETATVTLPSHTATPAVPQSVTVTPYDRVVSGAQVSWTMPEPTPGAQPTSFSVRYTIAGPGPGNDVTVRTFSSSPATLVALQQGETYHVQVRAANSHGASDWSAVTILLTPTLHPHSAPTVDRITSGDQSLTIHWSPPAIAGWPRYAGIELHYTYESSGAEQRVGPLTVTTSPHRLTGLDNGVTYSLQLSAHGAHGVIFDTTTGSAQGTPAVLSDVPLAPSLTVTPQAATRVSNPAPIALSWSSAVSGPRRAHRWELSYTTPDAETVAVVLLDEPSYVLEEPVRRTVYQFKVRAINDLGASAWSAVISETARSLASAVQSLEVTPKRGSVRLSWVAPVHIGHPRYDSYDLRWQALPGGAWTTVKLPTTATSHTISGLTNFQPIAVLLSPLNSTTPGIAAAGQVTLVTMAQGTPPALTGLQVVTNAQGQLVLRWDPATQPVPTFNHQNYLSDAWQTNWIDVEYINTSAPAPYLASLRLRAPASAGELVLTQLASGKRYRFRVRPVNHVEAGPWQELSEPYSPTSGSNQLPAAPTNLQADELTSNSVTISWDAPTSTGGTPIVDYIARHCRTFALTGLSTCDRADFGKPATSHQFKGLKVNLEYQVQVRAVNEAGRGPWSTALTVEPKPATDP